MEKAMEGPEDLCPGPQARLCGDHHTSKVCPLRAPSCCTCFAELNVDGEMRRLIHFPYLHLFFLKLKASMLGNPPLWRLWSAALSASLLQFAGFRAWQHANSLRSYLLA